MLSDIAQQPGRGTPSLEVEIRHRVGAVDLEVRFALTGAWTVLFAPSGAGKTTILRLIAGLDRLDEGTIVRRAETARQGGECVLADTVEGVHVAAHRRSIPVVAQRPALFPHRTVLGNVLYARAGQEGGSGPLEEVLELCRIGHLRDKYPAQISGGESQRVALARALLAPARVLLLDEPFTGLDSGLRDAMIPEVKAYLAGRRIPVLHVTHDVGEVFAVGAEVIRLEDGRVAAQGPAGLVLARERERLLNQLNG
jgi:molybdate transport system ATP-binding protein